MNGITPTRYRVDVSSSTIVRTLLFLALFGFAYLIRDILLVIVAAVVIASAIEPGTLWFERHRVPRIPAVLIIYLSVFIVIAFLFYFFVPTLVGDIRDLVARAPEYLDSLRIGNVLDSAPFFPDDFRESLTAGELFNVFQERVVGASSGFFSFVSTIFGGVVSFVLIVVMSFYLAVQREGIVSFLKIVTPFEHESYVIDLWRRSQRKIGRWLQGQLILMVIVGILVYLGLTILGVKNALILGLLAAFFEIIPLFGPILAAVPAISFSVIDGGLTLALMVAGLYVIIQQFENHLIHPLVVTKVVGVPPLIVIIALLIGGNIAGFLGVILSVPIAAALMEYSSDVEKKKQMLHEQATSSDNPTENLPLN